MLKKMASLLMTVIALLMFLSACAITDGKHPLRYEPTDVAPGHRPPPTSGGP
ncbi:MAG: hypothetical protein HPY67_04265 [Syntrophaceae bacterium]|nr:hypothetical protein [Syntrophaceae bacterium]